MRTLMTDFKCYNMKLKPNIRECYSLVLLYFGYWYNCTGT